MAGGVALLADATKWLPDSHLLTPTQNLTRRGITARYLADIEAM